jgi:hypothetical protein
MLFWMYYLNGVIVQLVNISSSEAATIAVVGSIFFRDWPTALYYLRNGARVDLRMSASQTIAHAAAILLESEQFPTAEHLKFAAEVAACPGFDPHAKNDDGQTAFQLAIEHGNFSVADLLAPMAAKPAPRSP